MQFDDDEFPDRRRQPAYREAQLLLRELQHRVSNEIAAAVAAMRLAKNAVPSDPRTSLFDQAIARLEGFGVVHNVLSARPPRTVDLGAEMHRLCRGLVSGRSGLEGSRIRLVVDPVEVPGGPAHRVLLIAAELFHNAIRHALSDRGGRMSVNVRSDDVALFLTVSDDGPGLRGVAATTGTGMGSGIVADLVRLGDGILECDSDRYGTTFRVTLPLSGPSPVDWTAEETMT